MNALRILGGVFALVVLFAAYFFHRLDEAVPQAQKTVDTVGATVQDAVSELRAVRDAMVINQQGFVQTTKDRLSANEEHEDLLRDAVIANSKLLDEIIKGKKPRAGVTRHEIGRLNWTRNPPSVDTKKHLFTPPPAPPRYIHKP